MHTNVKSVSGGEIPKPPFSEDWFQKRGLTKAKLV